MSTFLDSRSSMNSNTVGAPGVALTPTPALFGIIGLQTQGVANPLVTLSGSVGISGDFGDTYTVQIVRGASFSPANVIFTASGVVTAMATTQVVSFAAQDLLAPAALETVYTAFVSGVTTAIRNGPEVFMGTATAL
ncbi:hypothetical protein AWM70_21320 [Paenibacillus yonginensis]|uniref:BclA C-terminal domain-containing protein n=1 Tax=Paenibacillus yonginensis TaxID=1462996 RepID=A0A1B1N5U4_9BACL|nr:hypothetical protein [Paenibacillus yonginensis]ANS76810.1 hypothetical protein AWM70_21320 [Paenibacillus yonginensis]